MSVFLSAADKQSYVNMLSDEIRNDIMIAVENALNGAGLDSDEYQKAWDNAFNSRVSDLEDTIDIEYLPEKLSFYVVENLRFQQDGKGGFNLTRYDKLQDALVAFSEMPNEYTSAIGASLSGGKFGVGEIDLIHRKNGEPVLVNDFKFIERWDNPLIQRAVSAINSRLGVEYESDVRTFSDHTVLIPLNDEPPHLNSYFMDKYLRPVDGADKEVARRYGDLSQYAPNSHVHSLYLHSAINEVFVGGKGWMKAANFLKKLNSIDEYQSSERLKVMKLNINYVDLNGRHGQADIPPGDFALLKKQTIERTAQHPDIDVQIDAANKVRVEQMENKNKTKSHKKDRDEQNR